MNTRMPESISAVDDGRQAAHSVICQPTPFTPAVLGWRAHRWIRRASSPSITKNQGNLSFRLQRPDGASAPSSKSPWPWGVSLHGGGGSRKSLVKRQFSSRAAEADFLPSTTSPWASSNPGRLRAARRDGIEGRACRQGRLRPHGGRKTAKGPALFSRRIYDLGWLYRRNQSNRQKKYSHWFKNVKARRPRLLALPSAACTPKRLTSSAARGFGP